MAKKKYIDQKALLDFAHNHVGGQIDCNDIARFPVSDVAEVVRCKDCARSKMILDIIGNPRLFCTCWRGNPEVEFDDFCSYGEREETNHG